MGKAIGIDLGTTMSAMAVVDDMGRPVMIPNSNGKPLTPSAVLVRGDERVVGETAKHAAIAKPDNVFQFIKRRMCDPEFVFKDEEERQHRPEELSAVILKKLKQDAEQSLGSEVTEAVITVPAYFADLERNRTRQAGELAGFKVLDIINEPTAAALAYGLGKGEADITFLVYDLGGGTFDVTIMKVGTGPELLVLTSGGDQFLGGGDFDADLSDFLKQQFQRKHGIDLDQAGDRKTDQEFNHKAERAKIDLSSDTQSHVTLSAAGKVLDLTVKRGDFEKLIKHRIDLTRRLTEKALEKDAKLGWHDIDKVLLVGGSTRIPMVREMIRELTGKVPEPGINPDEVVALGAAVYAANLSHVPVRNEKGDELKAVRLRNVTAHALGVVALNDEGEERNSIIVEKDAEVPVKRTRDGYTTVEDNQTSMRIRVIQGEDEEPEHCIKVGEAILTGLPPQPKGTPEIEIALEYDGSGIVHLHARELRSGREVKSELECAALMSARELKQTADRVGRLKVR